MSVNLQGVVYNGDWTKWRESAFAWNNTRDFRIERARSENVSFLYYIAHSINQVSRWFYHIKKVFLRTLFIF